MRPTGAVLAHGQFRLMNGVRHIVTPTAVSRNETLPVGVIAIWSVNRTATTKDRSPRPNTLRHKCVPTGIRSRSGSGDLIGDP
jgi:hypothetical protein